MITKHQTNSTTSRMIAGWIVLVSILFHSNYSMVSLGFSTSSCRTPRQQQYHNYRHFAIPKDNLQDDGVDDSNSNDHAGTRRTFFQQAAMTTVTSILGITSASKISSPQPCHASGLLRFPCVEPLHNTYHLMRAGTSIMEEQDIISTNPLFLTNRVEAALSPRGIQQVLQAAQKLQDANIQPSAIRHSLAASSMDTAGIIRDKLNVGQNRINPEFVFMDPRAIGMWDGMSYQQTQAAIVALDELEAGNEGREGRPPQNTDGTPNETLFDQTTRLRQLMSGLETQYSGDTILLVFPDSCGPALLSAMMAGIPLNKVHLLDYEPGEIRFDVTLQSTLDLFQEKQKNQNTMNEYSMTVQRGTDELKRLRSLDVETIVNKKDQLIEEEAMAIEKEYQRTTEVRRKKEEEADRARLKRQQDIEKAWKQSDSSTTFDVAIGGMIGGAVIVGSSLLSFRGNDPSTKETRMAGTNIQGNEVASYMNTTDSFSDIDNRKPILPKRSRTNENLDGISGLDDLEIITLDPPNTKPMSLYDNPPVISETDRIVAARQSMEEYMNQDDGGEDWLRVMNDILEDDNDFEEDEEVVVNMNDSIKCQILIRQKTKKIHSTITITDDNYDS